MMSFNDTVNYTLSEDGSYFVNKTTTLPIHRKTYNNIKIKYCELMKKKIIYANPTKTVKKITITTLTPDHLKVKNPQLSIQPYSNGEIQLRIYYDHTAGKTEQAIIRIDDGEVIE